MHGGPDHPYGYDFRNHADDAACHPKKELLRALHAQHELSDHFIAYMLGRNIRVEEDLIDQLFNSSEKRLARTLLLLARYGKQEQPDRMLRVSQETLARHDRHHAFAREFLYEQIQEIGICRIQRQDQGQQIIAHGCLTRLERRGSLRERRHDPGPSEKDRCFDTASSGCVL